MDLQIEVFGDVQVNRKLLRFNDRAQDASPAFRTIAGNLRDWETRQFATEGAFASGGWDPLSPSTVTTKAREGLSPRILEATGALRESLTSRTDAGHVEIIGRQELVFGTQSPSARFHQRGTSRMPRRRPLEIRARDRADMVKTLQRHMVGELR